MHFLRLRRDFDSLVDGMTITLDCSLARPSSDRTIIRSMTDSRPETLERSMQNQTSVFAFLLLEEGIVSCRRPCRETPSHLIRVTRSLEQLPGDQGGYRTYTWWISSNGNGGDGLLELLQQLQGIWEVVPGEGTNDCKFSLPHCRGEGCRARELVNVVVKPSGSHPSVLVFRVDGYRRGEYVAEKHDSEEYRSSGAVPRIRVGVGMYQVHEKVNHVKLKKLEWRNLSQRV